MEKLTYEDALRIFAPTFTVREQFSDSSIDIALDTQFYIANEFMKKYNEAKKLRKSAEELEKEGEI